jgi:dienelactone hydrolase
MRLALALGLFLLAANARAAPLPPGDGQQTADLDGVPVEVFTHRPAGCRVAGLLLVFHGIDRNAGPYRNFATPLADRLCLLAVAPLLDAARFPSALYQMGGIVQGGTARPPQDWAVALVPRLAEWARRQEGWPDMPFSLLGHSAGAQFLSRAAAFLPLQARRIVIADPSSWVEASLAVPAPFGLGGVPGVGEAALRRYLAAPISMVVGAEDTGSRHLSTRTGAVAQGATRLERAGTVFRQAEATARAHGWPFGWRLITVPGVAHNARANFASAETLGAFAPAPPAR